MLEGFMVKNISCHHLNPLPLLFHDEMCDEGLHLQHKLNYHIAHSLCSSAIHKKGYFLDGTNEGRSTQQCVQRALSLLWCFIYL